jgi:hypothetical protein
VAALHRLGELLLVADKHDVARRGAHGDEVSERAP